MLAKRCVQGKAIDAVGRCVLTAAHGGLHYGQYLRSIIPKVQGSFRPEVSATFFIAIFIAIATLSIWDTFDVFIFQAFALVVFVIFFAFTPTSSLALEVGQQVSLPTLWPSSRPTRSRTFPPSKASRGAATGRRTSQHDHGPSCR